MEPRAVDLSFELAEQSFGTATVVSVGGEIDIATAPLLEECLAVLIAGDVVHVVVDLRRVTFLDSTALGVLVGAVKQLRSVEHELSLVCTEPRILKLFSITGLDEVFVIFDDVESALSR